MPLPERPQSPPDQQILAAAVAFARALRGKGLSASVDSEMVFIRMLAELDVRERQEVYWAALATFVHSPDERPTFDTIFESFWEGRPLDAGERGSEHGEADARMVGPNQQGGEALPQFRQEGKEKTQQGDGAKQKASREIPTGNEDEGGSRQQHGVLAAYSPAEQEADKKKLDLVEDELAAVRRLGDDIKRAAPRRRSRRLRPARGGDRLDMRRTVRNSLETDGEALRLAYTAQRLRPRRMLFICDVSGSMERYSRTLLGSLKAIVGANNKAEAFVFATKLTRLTKSLSGHDLERGIERARAAVPDWSGGTRIGQALTEFNHTYGRRGFARGAIVMVVSDGWDRGAPEVLAAEVRRIQLQAWRLVWINPRPMVVDKQPLAIGMRAAMPYIDDFVPGHDPRAIAGLATLVGGLGTQRPRRRMVAASELKPRPLPINGGQQPLNKPPPADQWPAAANY
ncbi:MAG: VWA domain-containing protein [Thermoleophilaceae bacterium]|nr:VWA domain-containing protein [Thermoleophilaceae bacterium]